MLLLQPPYLGSKSDKWRQGTEKISLKSRPLISDELKSFHQVQLIEMLLS